MKPFIVGIGRAGCRIANIFFSESNAKIKYSGVAVDTEKSELDFSKGYKIIIGEKFFGGNGTGKDLSIGKEIMKGEKLSIIEKIDRVKGSPDCFLVISGMGGGTGGAVAPLLEEMKRSYIEPVYYAGVLPSEEDLLEVRKNYSEVFKELLKLSDAQFFIDNNALKKGGRLRGRYNSINKQVFSYFNSLFEVGEVRSRDEVGTEGVTTGDTKNTLTGVSTIGIGEYEISDEARGIFRSKKKDIDKPELVISLTEEASKNFLMNFDIMDAQKALVVVSGPKRYLDFLGSIPARLWVEKRIEGEVRGGDMPSKGKKSLQVMLVFSGIKKSERIRQLYGQYKESKEEVKPPEKEKADVHEKLEVIGSKVSDIRDKMNEVSEELDKMLGEGSRGDE
ncbi:MAG: hypothetical protein ACE5J5_04190 [Candidatus Hydrothermarchaeales archaeon]